MPVSSFAPEMLQLFVAASQKTVTIELNNSKRATHLRFRFHKLRVAMRKENHRLTTIANSVSFSIVNGDLIASPVDNDFLIDIRKAGIDIEDAFEHEDPIDNIDGTEAQSDSNSSEEALRRLYKKP